MKKTPLFLLIMVSCMCFGQNFKYGVSADLDRSSIANVHDVSKGQFGGHLGVFVQFPLVPNDIFDSAWLYAEPHIQFSSLGERARAGNELQTYTNNYLSAALYIKYFFHSNGVKSNFFLFGGPRVEYLVSHEKSTSALYESVYYKFNLDAKINDLSYGASLGAGFRITDQWEAFIRFDRGFSKVYPDNPANTYNRLLAVGVNFYLSSDN